MDETQNEVALQLERLATAIKKGDYLVQSYALEQLATEIRGEPHMYGQSPDPDAPTWSKVEPTGELIFTLKIRYA